MDSLFCCSGVEPFRPRIIDKEAKFEDFMNWAQAGRTTTITILPDGSDYLGVNSGSCFVIQLVRQVNYGPLESKRFFVKTAELDTGFSEVTEQDLIQANYQKVNSYKNFRCVAHNKFFEINLYEKDPVNRHHWRFNIARPATNIDLPSNLPNASVKHSVTVSSQLEASHLTPPTQIETDSDLKSAPTTGLTPPMPAITFESVQLLETSTETAHGDVGRKEGSRYWKRDDHGSLIGGIQNVPDDDYFDDYPADDYGSVEGASRRSQSPEDYTACSSDSCGYCGHCSY